MKKFFTAERLIFLVLIGALALLWWTKNPVDYDRKALEKKLEQLQEHRQQLEADNDQRERRIEQLELEIDEAMAAADKAASENDKIKRRLNERIRSIDRLDADSLFNLFSGWEFTAPED